MVLMLKKCCVNSGGFDRLTMTRWFDRLTMTCGRLTMTFGGLTLALVVLSLNANAQKVDDGLHYYKNFKKNFVQVNETVYACRYETTNLDYLLFMEDVQKRMNPSVYGMVFPDTVRWRDPGSYNEPYVQYYLRHPAYANYPLVNVNYEQANFYINWLTQQYNNNPKRQFKKVAFKLPTKSEWQQAATANDKKNKFPWGDSIVDKPTNMVVNYCEKEYTEKVWFDTIISNEGKRIKATDSIEVKTNCHPIGQFNYMMPVNLKKAKQSKNGLYHVAGNVSEMINIKGECAGGNYRSNEFWLRVDSPNEFHPSYVACPLIGFRVFMQVLER